MSLKKLSVSIIIPNYNGEDLLEKNLPLVIKSSQGVEIIVVDDASTDGSVNLLKNNFPQIKVVTHNKNQRFAAACNTGVEAASGDIVVLLNTDVVPKDDFLAPLISPFQDVRVFAVGCAEINRVSNSDQVSGRSCGTFKRGVVKHWRCEDQSKESTLWVSGGSGAFRKNMWQQLKGMDTLFTPAYEEDRDLSYRALKRNWKVLHSPNSIVYHDHEQTNQRTLGQGMISLASHKNNLIFIWKNITQSRLIIQHTVWLPYHLVFSSIRTKGKFLAGFIWALITLPKIMQKRKLEKREGVIKDEAILN